MHVGGNGYSSHILYLCSKLCYLLPDLFGHFFFRSFGVILYPVWNVENGQVTQCFHLSLTTQTLVQFVPNSQFCQLLGHLWVARRRPQKSPNLLKKFDIVQCPGLRIHREQSGPKVEAWSQRRSKFSGVKSRRIVRKWSRVAPIDLPLFGSSIFVCAWATWAKILRMVDFSYQNSYSREPSEWLLVTVTK